MNEPKIGTQEALISTAAAEFISEASDLYVDFLTEGRRALATSLLRGLVLALASLERLSRLAPGSARARELRSAADAFHKLSLLIFLSAMRDEEELIEDSRRLRAYDTAADLSGMLIAASRRG